MASLKPPAATIVLTTGVCNMSGQGSVVRIGQEDFPFGRQGDVPTVILLMGWEPLFVSSWFHV